MAPFILAVIMNLGQKPLFYDRLTLTLHCRGCELRQCEDTCEHTV